MPVHYQSNKDKWVKCISTNGTIRAIAITATDISQFLIDRHGLQTPTSKIALGESLIAGLILSSYCKSGEKINLNIHGSGWCRQAIVDANADAEIRGYVIERPQEEVHLAKDIGPWGIGLLSVLRTKHDEAQPYIGTVPLLTGRLPKDLTFYWLQSEQVNSAVGIEVYTDDQGVNVAEGFLIQAMPGATDQDIELIESHLKKLHFFHEDNQARSSPVKLLAFLLEHHGFSIVEEKHLTVKCHCTLDRVRRSLSLVGSDEIQSMIDENKDFEIMCDFCSEKYIFNNEMLNDLLTKP